MRVPPLGSWTPAPPAGGTSVQDPPPGRRAAGPPGERAQLVTISGREPAGGGARPARAYRSRMSNSRRRSGRRLRYLLARAPVAAVLVAGCAPAGPAGPPRAPAPTSSAPPSAASASPSAGSASTAGFAPQVRRYSAAAG